MWPCHLHNASYKVSLCEWSKLNSLRLQSWQMQKSLAICSFNRFATMAALTTCLEDVFCTRQVKYRLLQRYLLRARPLCCSPSMQRWHRPYSLLLQSRLVAVFEVLPNQSDHLSPWRRTELLKNPGPSTITTMLRTKRCYGLAPLTDGCILVPITFPI